MRSICLPSLAIAVVALAACGSNSTTSTESSATTRGTLPASRRRR